MSPPTREVALSQIEPSRVAVGRRVSSLKGDVEGRSTGIGFLEEPRGELV